MKIRLLFLTLLCPAMYSLGQVSIRGKVTDGEHDLPFATVLLLDSDSAMVKNSVTAQNGEFIFDGVVPGSYLVSVSRVGHLKFVSQPIVAQHNSIELPEIILTALPAELGAVTVKASKRLFEQKLDRVVVNVQSSITSAGSTVLEVLEKSPGIVVNKQNNTITMNGRAGVRVLINGKSTPLPLPVVIQMLEGMSSSNVEKIELITNPSAKYDAEGSAGIINIVMKGETELGTNGTVGLTIGSKWAEVWGVNFNLTHRQKNLAFFVDYSILSEHNLHTFKLSREFLHSGFVQTINDYSYRENTTTQQNANAGLEWKTGKNTSLNLSFTGYRRNWDMDAITDDIAHVAKDSTIITRMNIHESNIWQSASAGIGLQTKVNSKTEMSFNIDYLYYHNDNPSQYDNVLFADHSNVKDSSAIDVKKETPIKFIIATADYKHTFSDRLSVEAGVKGVLSTLDNNVLVQQLKNNVWTTDSTFTSYSNLKEEVGASYLSAKWQPGEGWTINSGVRYEYTHTSIGTPAQKNLVNRKYGYLFPNLSIEKAISKTTGLQLSYSRRITRPTYNEIAPFVFFWGPNSFDAGNTELLPAISDAVKMGYRLKRWVVSLQWSHSKHEIDPGEPENDSANNVMYRHQNLKYLNLLALTNAWSFNLAPWWEVQINVEAQYLEAQTLHLSRNVKRHSTSVNVNVTNSIKLPRDFAFELSGMYQSKTLLGVIESLSVGSLNAGVQKKFGKGTVRFGVDDIFNTNNWRLKLKLPNDNNLNTTFYYYFHPRFIRLTYSRSFGNGKLKSVRMKSASEEERGRVSN